MAAFASDHISLALAPSGLELFKLIDATSACDKNSIGLIKDVQLIRHINNRIYKDIAWVPLAYLENGIDEVRAALKENIHYNNILAGFELINQGLELNTDSSKEKIWKGNLLLFRHEQEHALQSFFDHLSARFSSLMSFCATLDFSAKEKANDFKLFARFYFFMMFKGWSFLYQSRSLPDITLLAHRRHWIENRLIKGWQRKENSDPSIIDAFKAH